MELEFKEQLGLEQQLVVVVVEQLEQAERSEPSQFELRPWILQALLVPE
jgi:hypothetical protein